MPTDHDIREAYENGLNDGALAELRRLRTFTGVSRATAPRHDLAEHLAYPEYERRLSYTVEQVRKELQELREERDRATERADETTRAWTEAIQAHRHARETVGVLGKVKSFIVEPFLPEKSIAQDAEAYLDKLYISVNEKDHKLRELQNEHTAVTGWLDEMYKVTTEAGQQRLDDRVAAARNISSRRFKVFAMKEYLEADPRRQLRWQGYDDLQFPGGADFGYHWRRDGDDDPVYGDPENGVGNWRAVWIGEIRETAVFISTPTRAAEVWLLGDHISSMDEAMDFFGPLEERQDERNSLALLLDAYTDTYLKKKPAQLRS
ncbi:hypothetical protein [Paenarthrobacter histidinolovorans]|uniref:Uncharacterized protein n=1 Tax=Paenarthrobacter histidinolovorans TaxID=43664 RepID=A0ABW8MZF3_9MICC